MKVCPECGREYQSGDVCEIDGTALLDEGAGDGMDGGGTLVWDMESSQNLGPMAEVRAEPEPPPPPAAPPPPVPIPDTSGLPDFNDFKTELGVPEAPSDTAGLGDVFPDDVAEATEIGVPVDMAEATEIGAAIDPREASAGDDDDLADKTVVDSQAVHLCPTCGDIHAPGEECMGSTQEEWPPEGELADPLLGSVLKDSYRIESLIARGGMARVYRGMQLGIDRPVAIKVLLPDLQPDDTFVKRFFREAKVLGGLTHPNVLSLFDLGQTAEGLVFLVTELLEGATLDKYVPAGRGLPMAELNTYMQELCGAMVAAHGQSLIHRDLKPSNIFILAAGDTMVQVKVLDFGIAKPLNEAAAQLTQAGTLVGTPGYMAPEQYGHVDKIDHRCDIYGLGALLYLMAAGRPAFAGAKDDIIEAQLSGQPEPIDLGALGKPPGLNTVIQKAMRVDPAERFQSVRDLADAIGAVATGMPIDEWESVELPETISDPNLAPGPLEPSGQVVRHAQATTESSKYAPPDLGSASPWNRLFFGALAIALAGAVAIVLKLVMATGAPDRTAVQEVSPEELAKEPAAAAPATTAPPSQSIPAKQPATPPPAGSDVTPPPPGAPTPATTATATSTPGG